MQFIDDAGLKFLVFLQPMSSDLSDHVGENSSLEVKSTNI